MGLLNTSGKIKLLRVNEVGDRFGPARDFIEAEVIVQLEGQAGDAASGFQLRADANQPVRQGMLDLLRDAFNHGWRVHFDHDVPPGKTKGRIVRRRAAPARSAGCCSARSSRRRRGATADPPTTRDLDRT